jgi:cell division protein FtsQ
VPVAADGTLLRGLRAPAGLPLLRMEKPATQSQVTDPTTLRALLVTGAAPEGFLPRVDRVSEDAEQGIVLELKDGPEIIFGDADLVDEKWMAAVRVMADGDAAGATYIDVRLPERPVAGGLPVETIEPVAPAGDVIVPSPAPEETVPVDPTAAVPVDPTATTAPTTTTPEPTTAAPTESQP